MSQFLSTYCVNTGFSSMSFHNSTSTSWWQCTCTKYNSQAAKEPAPTQISSPPEPQKSQQQKTRPELTTDTSYNSRIPNHTFVLSHHPSATERAKTKGRNKCLYNMILRSTETATKQKKTKFEHKLHQGVLPLPQLPNPLIPTSVAAPGM